MKVIFVAGGTAGHVNPALAVASSMPKDTEILFVGNKNHMEYDLVTKAGFKFKHLNSLGIRRSITPKNIFHNIAAIILFLSGLTKSRKIINRFRPDVVIGFGGYVSCPLVLEATFFKGIKTLTHEQNAFPGVTTKLLANRVNKVLISAQSVVDRLNIKDKSKIVYTGNPVRKEVISIDKTEAKKKMNLENKLFILSFGGSLGAENLNNALGEYLKRFANKDILYMHGTGEKNYDEFIKKFNINSNNVVVRPYIDDMPLCMAAADLIISRAGAIALSEIECAGKPSILIPSPYVAENHQYHNAMELVNNGAAKIILEKDLTALELKKVIDDIISNNELEKMSHNAKNMAILDATEKIIKEINV